MHHVLSELANTCSIILQQNSGPEGRQKVAAHLSEILSNEDNVDVLIPYGTGERELLYQDPDLGFCILAHNYSGAKTSPPHDHGPSWAIYAQARGETEMNDYNLISAASEQTVGKVSVARTYRLKPGDAHVYNEGDLHSPTRTAPTSLLRVEGTDMSKVKRFRYELG